MRLILFYTEIKLIAGERMMDVFFCAIHKRYGYTRPLSGGAAERIIQSWDNKWADQTPHVDLVMLHVRRMTNESI